ncbi:MAG: HPF/RaiA family ribosome-associated protein [Methylovirgula sp.]
MQVPLEIAFRHCQPSESIKAEIESEARRLEKFFDRITSCRATVIAPNRRHGAYKIDIYIAMPGHKDIVVQTRDDVEEHQYVSVAIRGAFDAAQRQIEDAVREMRGDVRSQED